MYFSLKMFRWFLIVSLGTTALGRTLLDSSEVNKIFVDSNLSDFPWFKRHLPSVKYETKTESNVICQTEECKKLGNFILANMNKTVNPCDDFYEYACGNWKISNPMPKWELKWDLFSLVQKNARSKTREILNAKAEPDDILPVKLAKKWYKACMNEEAINDRGLTSIVSIVSRIGGWPLAMEDSEWELIDKPFMIVEKYYTNILGSSHLFDYTVTGKSLDDEDNESYIEINVPDLPLDAKLEKSREIFYQNKGYKNVIKKAAIIIANKTDTVLSQEKLGKDIDDLINFEKELLKIRNIVVTEELEDSQRISNVADCSDKEMNVNYDSMCNKDNKEKSKNDEKNRMEANKINLNEEVKNLDRIKHKQEKGINTRAHKKHKHNNKLSKNSKDRENSSHQHFKGKAGKLLFRLKKVPKHRNGNKRNSKQENNLKRQKRDAPINNREFDRKNENINEWLNLIAPRSKLPTNKQNKLIKKKQYKEIKPYEAEENNSKSNSIYEKDINTNNEDHDKENENINCIDTNNDNDCNYSVNDSDEDFGSDELEFEELSSKLTDLFKECFEDLFNEIGVNRDDISVKSSMSRNQLLEYMKLLKKTPNEVIVNYIHWSSISEMFLLNNDIECTFLYCKQTPEIEPRWLTCIDHVKMTDAISYQYVKKYFPEDVSELANHMINAMKRATKSEIERSTWMNEDMKKDAKEKVDVMKKYIGYPEWYNNNTAVENYYKGLKIVFNNFDNTLSYKKFEFLQSFKTLLQADDEDEVWVDTSPLTINAFFAFDTNTIGRNFDKNGKEFKWDEQMDKEYMSRADCFLKQYSSFSLETQNGTVQVDGNQTLGENIADCAGVHNLYKAFKFWRKNKGTPDPKLPGLEDYNDDQMFFLSTATTWCETIKPSVLIDVMKSDEHSVGRFRVLGGLSNSEEFAKAFSCPVGSKMNPEEKCNIWQ
ncbi:neprilysin-2-like isoform X2 [Prorops nasuta]|uniref:neprilysin-2-like isoform X2 n=1 Tax=Prorops nasuta TaxID=863751 RepID=UPI0034CF6A45